MAISSSRSHGVKRASVSAAPPVPMTSVITEGLHLATVCGQAISVCTMTLVMGLSDRTPRERMVRSAAVLIREHGLARTGMREIAEAADAPRGSLQHYFPDGKDQVVSEAIDWIATQVTKPLLDDGSGRPTPAAKVV